MKKLTKHNVLSNVSSNFKPFGQICVEMATTLQRAINVSDVQALLVALVRDGKVERHRRDGQLLYRKT